MDTFSPIGPDATVPEARLRQSLVPDTPSKATLCRYAGDPAAGTVDLQDSKELGNPEVLAGLAALPPYGGETRSCSQPDTDPHEYLLLLEYADGTGSWVSSGPGEVSCATATNGQFFARQGVAKQAEAAVESGTWPA